MRPLVYWSRSNCMLLLTSHAVISSWRVFSGRSRFLRDLGQNKTLNSLEDEISFTLRPNHAIEARNSSPCIRGFTVYICSTPITQDSGSSSDRRVGWHVMESALKRKRLLSLPLPSFPINLSHPERDAIQRCGPAFLSGFLCVTPSAAHAPGAVKFLNDRPLIKKTGVSTMWPLAAYLKLLL